jgi:basic amino acid/polyamine antiporter, APA family
VTAILASSFPIEVLGQLVSIGTLLAFVIVCISVVVLRRTKPNLRRKFRTPWVPFVPALGIVLCLVEMAFLPWEAWLRLAGWLALGLIVYFAYGRRNSMLSCPAPQEN